MPRITISSLIQRNRFLSDVAVLLLIVYSIQYTVQGTQEEETGQQESQAEIYSNILNPGSVILISM